MPILDKLNDKMVIVVPSDSESVSSAHVIQEEGVDLLQREKLNFIGNKITATDNPGNNATDITLISDLVVEEKAATFSAIVTEDVYVCDTSGGAFTCNLPTAIGIEGNIFHIKKDDSSANVLTVNSFGAETMDGDIQINLFEEGEVLSIVSDGAVWKILSRFGFAATSLLTVVEKAATFAAITLEDVYVCDSSGGAFTCNLPTAIGIEGKVFHIKKEDTSINVITVNSFGAENMDGIAQINLTKEGEVLSIVSDGALWKILSRYKEAGTEKATAHTTAAQTINNATPTIIDFSTVDTDVSGLITTGASWKWTSNFIGYVSVDAMINLNPITGAIGRLSLVIRKNGADFALNFKSKPSTGGAERSSVTVMHGLVPVSIGDYIDIQVYQNSGGSQNLSTIDVSNIINIRQVQ